MNTEAEVVANLATKSASALIEKISGPENEITTVVAIPSHLTRIDLSKEFDENRGHPLRAKGQSSVDSLDSFINLVNERMARTNPPIVYVSKKAHFVAVLNEHGVNPGFRDYRVEYSPETTKEWAAWTGKNDKPMNQGEFAEFLEDRCLDVVDIESVGAKTKQLVERLGVTVATPPGLRALAHDFSVRVKQTVRESRVLSSGETQFVFATEHAADNGKPLTVPGAFLIAIPIFVGGPLYTLIARLRYRIADGRVFWFYKLSQVDESERDAVQDMRGRVAKELSCLVVEGNP